MRTVNVHEAKTQFSALHNAVEAGEQIIIAKAAKPVARLLPFEGPAPRELGIDDAKIWIADDFDTFIPSEFEPYSEDMPDTTHGHGWSARRSQRRVAQYPITLQDARS